MAAARSIRPWDDNTDQEARVARAFQSDFVWTLTPAGAWLCETPQEKLYVVSAEHCSCPDFEHRCSKAGAKCKHQISLAHKLLAEGTALLTPVAAPEVETVPCEECGQLLPAEQMACEFHEEFGTAYLCPDCKDRLDKDAEEVVGHLAPANDPFSEEASQPPKMSAEEYAAFRRVMGIGE